MRLLPAAFFLLLWTLAAAPPAAAQKRVALVIGNGAYEKVPKLPNPTNDAGAMEALFKTAGFDKVVRGSNLTAAQMRRALRDFSAEARAADIAIVFFAGHGIEVNGVNYLIPVDASLEHDLDVPDETVPLDRVNELLEGARRLRLVILDACRDNPFLRTIKRTLSTTRSIGRGLAELGNIPPDTLVAYAAKAGSTAADGVGTNSPFTTALVKHLATPGLDIQLAFRRVRDDVLESTARRQEPFTYGTLGRAEIPLVPAAATAPNYGQAAEAARICREVEGMSSLSTLGVLERQHKGTPAGDCVKARIAEIQKQSQPASPPPPAPAMARCVEVAVAGAGKRCLNTRDTFQDCFTAAGRRSCGPRMVVVPPGRFLMGTSQSDISKLFNEYSESREYIRRESPEHEVTIPRPFAVAETHVTRGEFAAFVTATGHKAEGCEAVTGKEIRMQPDKSWRNPGFDQDDTHPVVCVNWHDTQAYIAWLNAQTGMEYRLLSEAEVEYATRGVTTPVRQARYFFGNDPKDLCRYGNGADLSIREKYSAWSFTDCTDGYAYTAPVGRFAANPFGLKDVHGNVWTWTQDCYEDDYKDAPTDGSARTSGMCSGRPIRGGSWDYGPADLRSASRHWDAVENRNAIIGFRLARSISQSR